MHETNFPLSRLEGRRTPVYYYDLSLLRSTLAACQAAADKRGYIVHYAMKANTDDRLLELIKWAGLGCDCVSGGEVRCALEHGFEADKIVFAGVGKADWEIDLALEAGIGCFNVESLPELEVINTLAQRKGRTANVALRVNPNVDAHTHQYITTGLEENKFGIGLWELDKVVDCASQLSNVNLMGLHFHIGSQITDMGAFQALAVRVSDLLLDMERRHVRLTSVNVGGGLGIDYEQPDKHPIADFEGMMDTYQRHLRLREGQQLHFELGRSIVGQCGTLLSRVLYVKKGQRKQFCIIDAGMNDLIRPALYHAAHKVENLTSQAAQAKYDVVGPVCESSDCFGQALMLPRTERGDVIAIRSAGAYGAAMASNYNLRDFAPAMYSE